jgi:hypothetical protein
MPKFLDQVSEANRSSGVFFLAGAPDTPIYQYKRRLALAWFRRIDFVGKRALEVGCGPGANLLEAIHLGASMIAG